MSEGRLFFANGNLRYFLAFAKSLYFKFKKLLEYKGEQKCSSLSSDYGCWHGLPEEILEKIVQNLGLSDRIRLSILCKSWRPVVMNSSAHEFPWLVLPQSPDCSNDKTLSFFSLSDGKVVDLKLPKQVQGGWFYGSSKGWLIMIKEQGLNSQIFLLNPISGDLHQLPSLATIPSFQKYVEDKKWKLYGGSLFFHQIVLSTSNVNSDQCVVAASFDSCDELALCRPGGKTWSVFRPLDHEHEGLAQLLFSSGKLYALIGGEIKKEGIVAQTLRFGDHALELMMVYVGALIIPPIGEIEEYNDHEVYLQGLTSSFLLESTNNEVLLIHKVDDYFIMVNNDSEEDSEADILEGEDEGNDMEEEGNYDEGDDNYNDNDAEDVEGNDEDEEEEDEYYNENNDWNESMYARTNSFKVYKIDSKTDTNNFLRLQSLGDQMLFLAEHGSLSLCATDFKESEKNCIYFATKATMRHVLPKPQTSREIGLFNLDTE
ncbi:uncharacterized protein LOC112170604 [Rosa chinensis]|uniref:uncharacterized protein LOC112170604 n=1 Tax=Rosa chinensis TaxID=74649 RepID=UPI000D09434A|nr:uncharacterized protein LOC112170604 [Rosa chinensis]